MQTMEEPFQTSCIAANASCDGATERMLYGGLYLYLTRDSVYEFGRISSPYRCTIV